MTSRPTPISLRARTPEIVAALLDGGVDIRIRLSGLSMKPLVPSGSALWFSAKLVPEVGDIALLRYPNDQLVAHRVLHIDDEQVWTKGDSCRASDPAVPRSQILGCATVLEAFERSIPLRNNAMRSLGRLLSLVYPKLVRAFRTVYPRKDELPCAS